LRGEPSAADEEAWEHGGVTTDRAGAFGDPFFASSPVSSALFTTVAVLGSAVNEVPRDSSRPLGRKVGTGDGVMTGSASVSASGAVE
jgi:hypothetical protein